MKNNQFSILFVIRLSKRNKKGQCPVYCRITYNKKRHEFSTGIKLNPKAWNSKRQKVISKGIDTELINNNLEIINQNVKRAYLKVQLSRPEFNVWDIADNYFGRHSKKQETMLNYFANYLKNLKELVGIDLAVATYKKYEYVESYLKSFVRQKYKSSDIPLEELELVFLDQFEFYLKTKKQLGQSTINKIIQRLKRPIRVAVAEGYLDKDPFQMRKIKRVKKEVIFLTPEELKKVETNEFSQIRLSEVQGYFIFSCYTGLAFNEFSKLETKHVSKGFDGNLWINMKRNKTDKPLSIPLLPKAIKIYKKYALDKSLVFPKISNQKYNSYLKEVGAIVGIEKKLTTHMARRTFASTVLLYNDVPMEIGSELLGHSSIKVTEESYGKIVQKRVSMEVNMLKSKLKISKDTPK